MTMRADESARMGGFSNLDTQQLQALCFTSARTVRRWKKTDTMPRLAHFVCELMLYGHLGSLSRAFDGWHLRGGALHAPDGVHFAPNELRAVPLKYQLLSELEKQHRDRARDIAAPKDATNGRTRAPCRSVLRRGQRNSRTNNAELKRRQPRGRQTLRTNGHSATVSAAASETAPT